MTIQVNRLTFAGIDFTGRLVRSPAHAAGNWGFGSDLGLTTGTVDNTVFTLGFNLDYYVDRNFSFGPMMLLTPTGDLFQAAFAGVGKYHIRLRNGINLVPFTGIGLVPANLDRGTGPEEYVAVYVPTNHLYLGDVFVYPRSQASYPDLTVEEGLRIFLTGGMSPM